MIIINSYISSYLFARYKQPHPSLAYLLALMLGY